MESKVGKEFLNEYKIYVLGYLGKAILNYNDASEEDKKRTAFEEFVVNFVVAFSGCALLFLMNII